MPLFDEQGATVMLSAWKDWLEGQPLELILPPEKVKAFVRRASDEKTGATEVVPRVERAFDAVLSHLARLDRSAAQLLGPSLAQRVVDAAGDLEPQDEAVRAFFEERAMGDLLGAVLYDGIVEFLKKANQLSDFLPGAKTAKKLAGGMGGFLGGLAGGLAGSIAGGVREEVEKKLEAQVRAFLQGFGKAAVERAARFATAPQNKKLFREMRMNLARKALDRPVKDLVERTPPERRAELKQRLKEGVEKLLAEERATHRLEAGADRLIQKHGKGTIAEAAKRVFGDVLPTEMVAKLLAPTLARFPGSEAVRAAMRDAILRFG